jgi:phospholipid/cholesterol/gamma-HCH transport system substrate-binding protein
MRRIVATLALLAAASLVLFGQAASGGGDDYKVRAIFDNGSFLVPGEQVRIAGANVGSVSSVDVTMPGEPVHRDGKPDPGKAVVVLAITDPGFQNFLQDASCLIRPQSLLGEKYVDCTPTQARAPGSAAPPPLKQVPSGEPGAGERFLPLENNGKEVDLDLVNNIMREPFADRFRLILNDLGAGLAARGEDLAAIIKRADPALRQTDRVLAVLARQNHQLARLAANSDTVLTPLARERQHLTGFINNANTAAEATAERSQDLEAGFQRFPAALRQLRLTMSKLRSFSDQATPVFAEFRAGAPGIARATRALGPFAHAATPALTSLGTAAEQSQQPLVNSDPILRKVRKLAVKAGPGADSLARLLASLRTTGGYKSLMSFFFNTTGGINGFDQFGHFLRASLKITNCTQLVAFPTIGCGANWGLGAGTAKAAAAAKFSPSKLRRLYGQNGGASQPTGGTPPTGQPLDAQGQPAGGTATTPSSPSSPQGRPSLGAARALLDTVFGRQRPSQRAYRRPGGGP